MSSALVHDALEWRLLDDGSTEHLVSTGESERHDLRCAHEAAGFGVIRSDSHRRGVVADMSIEQHRELRMLTVCGSLQNRSANRAALDAASIVAISRGATVDVFDRLAEIPAFDPDRAEERIEVIDDWRRRVMGADVVLVAVPEYAGAVAGAVKNAFDWLVGSGSLYRKPIAVLSAGTSGGPNARRMMTQTLTWQGAYVVAELGIAAPRTKSDRLGRLNDEATLAAIASLTRVLLGVPAMAADDLVALATRVVDALHIDVAHIAPTV